MDKKLTDIIEKYREKGGNIISLLQETQEAFGYIPKNAVDFFSEELGIAASRFYGVATFYSQFRMKPVGRHTVVACCGTACYVRGAEKIMNGLKRELRLSGGEDTTEDGEITLEQVACLGNCSSAPVVLINGTTYGKTGPDVIVREIRKLGKKK